MKPDITKTRVLLVNSSASFLSALERVIDRREIHIIDRLNSGLEAIIKTEATSPDIIIIDLDLPLIDGSEAIEHIMATQPTPILATQPTPILATTDERGVGADEVLKKGALELMDKFSVEKISQGDFTKKIKFLANVTVFAHHGNEYGRNSKLMAAPRLNSLHRSQKIVSIVSSTGGPRAISEILASLPPETPFPIVIAQHMPDGFTDGMVRWLNTISRIPVKVAEVGEILRGGLVYFSPSEKHMVVGHDKRIGLANCLETDIFHPSCDRLLFSVASAYGVNVIAVILTGMGNDGVSGIRRVKDRGGFTMAQDEASSSLFGMPKEAIDSGCIDKTVPLDSIALELKKHFGKEL